MVRSVVASLTLVLVAASSALALQGGPTRADFVAGADKICRKHQRDANPSLRRGQRLVADRKYRQGAEQYLRGIEVLRGIRAVRGVPHPQADDARIDRWIDGELKALTLASRGWKAVKKRAFGRAERLLAKSERTHGRSHRPVRGFRFEHCT